MEHSQVPLCANPQRIGAVTAPSSQPGSEPRPATTWAFSSGGTYFNPSVSAKTGAIINFPNVFQSYPREHLLRAEQLYSVASESHGTSTERKHKKTPTT